MTIICCDNALKSFLLYITSSDSPDERMWLGIHGEAGGKATARRLRTLLPGLPHPGMGLLIFTGSRIAQQWFSIQAVHYSHLGELRNKHLHLGPTCKNF